MSQCTCARCLVCEEGKCDCTCRHGPHMRTIDVFEIRKRLADMSPKQRKDFINSLTKDLEKVK